MEVSPSVPAGEDYFLHVLTATGVATASPEPAVLEETATELGVRVGRMSVRFGKQLLGGHIEVDGQRRPLSGTIKL